jgi:hypothetical protein
MFNQIPVQLADYFCTNVSEFSRTVSNRRGSMTKYFFDVKVGTCVEHDFTGRLLSTLEQARQLADMIATDVSCTMPDATANMEVQIRSSEGTLISSVPIKTLEPVAA